MAPTHVTRGSLSSASVLDVVVLLRTDPARADDVRGRGVTGRSPGEADLVRAEIDTTTANQTLTNKVTIDGAGANAIRINGSSTSTGYLSHTDDGSLLTFTGARSTDTTMSVASLNPRAVVTLNANRTLTVAPDPNVNGQLGFDYTVSNGTLTDVGRVTLDIAPVADAPVLAAAISDQTATANQAFASGVRSASGLTLACSLTV